MQKLFWLSTDKPSKEFIEYFKLICLDYNIANVFQIPSSLEIDIKNYNELLEKSILIPQRSNEWFKLRKIYLPNGVNKENIYDNYIFEDDWVEKIFHLIKGSIGEQYIMYKTDWNKLFPGYKFINVGLLINKLKYTSISPDGFLVNNDTNDIIPIEIKCLKIYQSIYSNSSIREIEQAIIQLKQITNYLSNIKKGIIIFLFFDTKIIKYTLINL